MLKRLTLARLSCCPMPYLLKPLTLTHRCCPMPYLMQATHACTPLLPAALQVQSLVELLIWGRTETARNNRQFASALTHLASLLQAHADAGPAVGASEEAQACVHKLQTQVIETPLFLLMVSSAAAAASLLLQMDDPFRLATPLLLVMMY